LEPKKLTVSPCDRIWVAGTAKSLHIACDDRATKKLLPGSAPPPNDGRAIVRIYRSEDEGKSWVEDGSLPSRRADLGRAWLSLDGGLAIDGACKRLNPGRECYDTSPVIRNPGQKAFAKIGLPHGMTQMSMPAFDGARNAAYALGRSATGPLKLLVSNDGGRDFKAVSLPTVPALDAKSQPLVATHAEPGSITVDPATGTVVA